MAGLDVKVGELIMEECFGGFLKGKTRVIFCNSFKGLKGVDEVFFMREGVIIEKGDLNKMREKYSH
jgi:ABC-type transport system involved in cytochrome bd biosynthesis fused ATPase/permease subunit